MMERYIDLRSDTVTQPTPAMRTAMAEAVVGDDVYCDDPTVAQLEALAATITGKEAALFVVSGTMGNQIAIMSHTALGDEVIAGASSHIVHYECGAPARLSGVNLATVCNPDSIIYPEDIVRLVRPVGEDPHFPRSSLLCLENALCNGNVVPMEVMHASYTKARELGLAVHLDGARIFNAALALGVDACALAACADSVMFCLSKGLCAPVGSMLCGSREFIARARRMRKVLGGGMRQAGVLAACGIVALEQMIVRLKDDHANAHYLARELAKTPHLRCDEDRVKINMVFWSCSHPRFDSTALVARMLEQGIKISAAGTDGVHRFATSNDVSRADLDTVLACLHGYMESM